MRFPVIAFIVVPMAELLLLFEVAEHIGGFTTLMVVVTTAFIGITILKYQGFSTLRRADFRMQQGQLPAQEIVEGMLLAFAGALLLTPGLITDAVGFACLTPPIRRAVARRILRSGTSFLMGGGGPGAGGGFHYRRSWRRDEHGNIVEGEFVQEDDPEPRSPLDRDDRD